MICGPAQEWKSLMGEILSEEANKIQAELEHASNTMKAWQDQSAGTHHCRHPLPVDGEGHTVCRLLPEGEVLL